MNVPPIPVSINMLLAIITSTPIRVLVLVTGLVLTVKLVRCLIIVIDIDYDTITSLDHYLK